MYLHNNCIALTCTSFSRKKSRVYPSTFLHKRTNGSMKKGKGKLYTYERDIICIPKFFCEKDVVQIPRKKSSRQFLAVNKLVGKIQLQSSMSEFEIFQEIRSVFRVPMGDNDDFQFKVLQPSGGDSRCLMIPELSLSYKWSASAVAGRNAKTPIYIMAEDNLQVLFDLAIVGYYVLAMGLPLAFRPIL